MAAFNVRSADGSVVEKLTSAHIELTAVDANEANGTERRYYVRAVPQAGDHDALRSHVFGPSQDGKAVWDNVIFPVDGTWDLELRDVSDDSVVASDTVVVAAP